MNTYNNNLIGNNTLGIDDATNANHPEIDNCIDTCNFGDD